MANLERWAQGIGLAPAALSTSTFALSTANNYIALGVLPSDGKTLSKVKVYGAAVSGTLAGGDLRLDVFSSTTAGVPNVSLSSTTTVTATPTGAGWVEFTGLSQALTANTQYWLVVRNLNASPASNNLTIQTGAANTAPTPGNGSGTGIGWHRRTTTDAGGTWTSGPIASPAGWRVEYSDGTFDGLPVSAFGGIGTTFGIYGTRKFGVRLTSPTNAGLKVRGVTMLLLRTGTPQPLAYELLNGTTSLGASGTVDLGATILSTSSGAYVPAFFAAPVTVPAGTDLRVVATAPGGGGSTANCARGGGYTAVENNANSKALMPYGARQTYYDGSTWAEDDTVVPFFALLLDTDGEFASTGGGGSSGTAFFTLARGGL